MRKLVLLVFLLVAMVSFSYSQRSVALSSPDGKLRFTFTLKPETPVYQVAFGEQVLIKDSPVNFNFDSGSFGANLKTGKAIYRKGDETYQLTVGKNKTIHSQYKEVTIPLEEKEKPYRKINIVVRAFDDGIAFRYEFPEQANWKSYVMYDENLTFDIQGTPRMLALYLPSYINSHEGLYTYADYNSIHSGKLIDMPATFVYPNGTHLAITEAAVLDYAGMYLLKNKEGILTGVLSPSLKDPRVKVEATLPHRSPWRVIMVGNKAAALMESNILTNLNDPCKIENTSWIKPGKTTFTWWNGNVVPDTTFSPGNNFMTNKYYIDFAARNKLDFHSIYGYAEQPWYVDDGFDFGNPGSHVDITKSIAPLNMKEICDYAKSQGVNIHVWLNWKALYPQLDKAFEQFEQWGIVGMMVDFMNRDDQEMIRIQEEILAKAAKHHLFIQFHGSSKPSGLHRTYPNEFTREGTLNYENYKWDTIINADHDISMPFARGLAGPADYHLGGFRSLPKSEFKVHFTNPYVTSTRCHMLGMYLVLESYLAMVCDTPESYEGQPGFELLRDIPTVWDKTIVPDAVVNEYAVVAREKDGVWYVGAINNSKARQIKLPLDFLTDGNYTMETYFDAEDTDSNPNHLVKKIMKISNKDVVDIALASNGGAAIRIRK